MWIARSHCSRLFAVAFLIFGGAVTALAQTGVGVEIDEIVDNRMGAEMLRGWLEVRVKLTGQNLDRVASARVLVKTARDDKGTILSEPDADPDFQARDSNMGRMDIRLKNPVRSARSVQLSGTIELFVPGRDPNAVVKLQKALAKTDKPLDSKTLRAEKIVVTVLSTKNYLKQKEAQKLDETKIAEARAEGKRQGVSDKEIEAMIELVKALQELGNEPLPDGAVILSGKEDHFDRIQTIRILRPDGKEVSINGRSSTTSGGGDTLMILNPAEPPPSDATLELTVMTAKTRVSVPFELKSVALP